jgi:hypothetical protein
MLEESLFANRVEVAVRKASAPARMQDNLWNNTGPFAVANEVKYYVNSKAVMAPNCLAVIYPGASAAMVCNIHLAGHAANHSEVIFCHYEPDVVKVHSRWWGEITGSGMAAPRNRVMNSGRHNVVT